MRRFHLERFPKHVTVAGGGYIAVEFAGIFNGLGAQTAQLYRGEQILRGFDDDLRYGVAEEMLKKNIDLRTHSVIEALEPDGDRYKLTLNSGDVLETDLVMFATGRHPNTDDLGLDKAGVELNDAGAVAVDACSRTNVENIYAVGDVTDRLALTPIAIREGAAFAETVFNHNPTEVDHATVATAVFSQPELGTVGLTEAEARERYGEVDIYKSKFRPMKHTLSGRDEKMMMKVIVDAATDKVVGCHIMGPRCRRDGAGAGHRGQDGRDQEGFRRHGRRAPEPRRRNSSPCARSGPRPRPPPPNRSEALERPPERVCSAVTDALGISSGFVTDAACLDPDPGSYVLTLKLSAPVALRIPRFAGSRLEPGIYAYAGSARGPGGIAARVGRHLSAEKTVRWHIDHLTTVADAVWASVFPRRRRMHPRGSAHEGRHRRNARAGLRQFGLPGLRRAPREVSGFRYGASMTSK